MNGWPSRNYRIKPYWLAKSSLQWPGTSIILCDMGRISSLSKPCSAQQCAPIWGSINQAGVSPYTATAHFPPSTASIQTTETYTIFSRYLLINLLVKEAHRIPMVLIAETVLCWSEETVVLPIIAIFSLLHFAEIRKHQVTKQAFPASSQSPSPVQKDNLRTHWVIKPRGPVRSSLKLFKCIQWYADHQFPLNQEQRRCAYTGSVQWLQWPRGWIEGEEEGEIRGDVYIHTYNWLAWCGRKLNYSIHVL